MRSRRLAATVPVLLALLLPAGASAGQLSIAASGNAEFPQRSYVLQIDPPTSVDSEDVRLRESGRSVPELEVRSASGSGASEFASVLVIDASLSVKGEAIEEAMNAARSFAVHRAPDQQLGVIAFNGSDQLLLPLTTDEEIIQDALSAPPQLAGGTRLYDAVASAVSMLTEADVEAGSVVVLSDGTDTGSAASEEAVVRQAAEAGVRIFVVGLESDHFDPATLTGLASDADYTAATDPRQLESIFSSFAAQHASEVLIGYRSEAAAGERVTVEVNVEGVPGTARAGYQSPRGNVGAASADDGSASAFWDSTIAMLGAALLIALLLGSTVFVALRPRGESVIERLSRFGVFGDEPDSEQPFASATREPSGPLAAIERRLDGDERWWRFEESLDVAEVDLPAITIAAATALATLLAMVLILAIAPFPVLALLALAIPLGVRAEIARRVRAVHERFAEDLADNLQVVASAIRAGHSMVGALAVLVEEASGPAREEFQGIVAAERVGVPLEESIREVARRMANRDMEQLALVAIIQRQTGGNTAEIIDHVVSTIRERAELRRMMASLTAQGRLTRLIVTALPVLLLVAISLINPGYIAPLFETTAGQVLLAIAAGMVLAGSVVIKRIVDIRV